MIKNMDLNIKNSDVSIDTLFKIIHVHYNADEQNYETIKALGRGKIEMSIPDSEYAFVHMTQRKKINSEWDIIFYRRN